jgi:outer membrane protein TolC
MVDVVRVDIMIDNAKTEIELLNAKIDPLEIVFNRLLNSPDSAEVAVQSFPQIDRSQTYFLDSLVNNNPKLLSLNENSKAAHTATTLASKQGLPSIGIGLDYAIVDERTDIDVPDNGKDILMPMVTLNLPLFRKKYNSAVQESTLRHQGIEYQMEQLTNELISNYEIEQYKLKQSVTLIELYENQVAKTRQAIDLLYADYANSGKDFEEILRLEQQIIRYNLSKSTALKEYFVAKARLDYLTAKSL